MIKYEEFLNEEAKVNEFEIGTICNFKDCSFNDGRDYFHHMKAIVTEIKKEDKISTVSFVFYEGPPSTKTSIILNSRQLRKIQILGKDMELLGKIQSGKLVSCTYSHQFRQLTGRVGFQVYAYLLDKTSFDIDKNNPENITYIDAVDFKNVKEGEDVNIYRKSIHCEKAFAILNPSIKEADLKRIVSDYIYESTYNKKVETGEYVRITVSNDFNQAIRTAGFYIDRQYSDITNIDIDWNNKRNATYSEVKDIKDHKKVMALPDLKRKKELEKFKKSAPIEEILSKLKSKMNSEYLKMFADKYAIETEYMIDKKEGRLAPLVYSKRLDVVMRKIYMGVSKTHYLVSNFDIDMETPGNITCMTALDIKNGKTTKKSITPEEFIRIIHPQLAKSNIDAYAVNIKRELLFEIRLEKGEIRKFEASKEILNLFQKIGFYVGLPYYDVSRFDIDVKEPGKITCIPSIKIKNEKNPEEFRVSMPCEEVFKILNPGLSKANVEVYAEKFKKQVIIEIKIKKGEVVLYKASESFNYVTKAIKLVLREQYLDCSSFDVVKDNIDMISFIPAKKGILENPEKFRQQTRAGRIFKKLDPTLTEIQIEKLVNLYRAEVESFFNPPDIQVMTGDKIVYWYLSTRYASGGGTLNNSCMRGDQAQQRVAFYGKFPDYIGLAVLIKNNKLYGRALIWKCDDGRVFMDRIYTVNSHDEVQFIKFGAQRNYIMRNTLISGNEKKRKVSIELPNEINLNNMPYLDTMSLRKFGWVDAAGNDIPPSKNPKVKFVIRLESNYGKP